jgi:hypothetical protein
MTENDELEEVAANVRILVRAELEAQHRLGYHDAPAEECPVCRTRAS